MPLYPSPNHGTQISGPATQKNTEEGLSIERDVLLSCLLVCTCAMAHVLFHRWVPRALQRLKHSTAIQRRREGRRRSTESASQQWL